MRSKLFPFIGIGCGILAIIFAIVVFSGGGGGVSNMDTGTYTSYNYYGGDAYTGIQQAAADTARNVQSLARIVRTGFQGVSGAGLGYLLLIIGFALIVYSLHTLNEIKARDRFEAQVLAALTSRHDAAGEKAVGNPEPETVYAEEPVEEPETDPVEEEPAEEPVEDPIEEPEEEPESESVQDQ